MQCHEHRCNHYKVEYCQGCRKVFCKDCKMSWQEECRLSHYSFGTTTPTWPIYSFDTETGTGVNPNSTLTRITCNDHS